MPYCFVFMVLGMELGAKNDFKHRHTDSDEQPSQLPPEMFQWEKQIVKTRCISLNMGSPRVTRWWCHTRFMIGMALFLDLVALPAYWSASSFHWCPGIQKSGHKSRHSLSLSKQLMHLFTDLSPHYPSQMSSPHGQGLTPFSPLPYWCPKQQLAQWLVHQCRLREWTVKETSLHSRWVKVQVLTLRRKKMFSSYTVNMIFIPSWGTFTEA